VGLKRGVNVADALAQLGSGVLHLLQREKKNGYGNKRA
jgi:hypothetical protein